VEVNGRKVLINSQTGAKIKDLGIVTSQISSPTINIPSISNSIINPNTDAAVADIIKNNPNEWGHAADAIDAKFGAGTATTYDSWLKAVYQNGQKIDNVAKSMTANPPNPNTANVVDPAYGRTPNSLYQAALEYTMKGGNLQQFVGGLSSKDPRTQAIKDYISNKAGAIATALGSSFPQIQAMYKVDSAAATKLVTQALFIKTYLATATDNLDLALSQSDQVSRTNAKIANNYIQWAQGNFTPAGPLAEFETYIYTASREYAKVTSGGAMSAQGLSDSAQREAAKLLNTAQSPEAFKATVGAMKLDMANVVNEMNNSVSGISSSLGIDTSKLSGNSNQQTVKSNGQDYIVGQIYNDGNANWTVDKNGKWTKQ